MITFGSKLMWRYNQRNLQNYICKLNTLILLIFVDFMLMLNMTMKVERVCSCQQYVARWFEDLVKRTLDND